MKKFVNEYNETDMFQNTIPQKYKKRVCTLSDVFDYDGQADRKVRRIGWPSI